MTDGERAKRIEEISRQSKEILEGYLSHWGEAYDFAVRAGYQGKGDYAGSVTRDECRLVSRRLIELREERLRLIGEKTEG